MSVASEELRRERQREVRARKRLRQRIERARWRAGCDDWIVSDEELDALLAGEKAEAVSCVTAHKQAAKLASVAERSPSAGQDAVTVPRSEAERIFNLIRDGVRTWDTLLKLSRLNADELGLALCDLFNERRIRSFDVDDVRVYEPRAS